ncbi:MAG TPA: hypothetical protein VFJ87_04580 [Rhodanobacteraceae bacterium]|nr:hypothetical protein [Rhodanobacteraceae bacterium]
MSLRIAIQPDAVEHPNGDHQSFSRRWFELAPSLGIEALPVDVFASDCVSQIAKCDAFMWRCPSSAYPRVYSRRLLYALEAGLGIPVFPSNRSTWFYDDKPGQSGFLEAANIPHAITWVFWERQRAEQFCNHANYPFVLKLAGGHQSSNVRLLRTRAEALFYVDELFGHGVVSLGYRPASRPYRLLRRLRAAAEIMKGRNPYGSTPESELQHGYFYAQEFLAHNEFEISVIVIGRRAFACRRFVSPGDFRTHGSDGRIDWSPQAIDTDIVRLAFRVARKLRAQTVAVDILRRGAEPVVIELTVNYAAWVVAACPGHWLLEGEPGDGKLAWAEGSKRAADAILEDFLAEISNRGLRRGVERQRPRPQRSSTA